MIATTEAIVLHTRKYGDTSKIISMYTLDDGLISVIAKGSRLPKNKFGSSIESLSHSQISYYKKPSRDLYLLSKSELIKNFRFIFDSSEKLNAALGILESISLTQTNHEANDGIFKLLVLFLNALNECDHNEYNYFLKFQFELARLTGFELDFSFLTYEKEMEFIFFSITAGEFCYNPPDNNYLRVPGPIAVYMSDVNKSSISELNSLNSDKNNIKVINSMLCRYFSFHLDKYFHYKTFDTY